MKTKKLLFLTAILMVFSVNISIAQAGSPAPCGAVTPYYNISGTGNWPHPAETVGQEIAVSLGITAGANITVGIDPKTAGTTLVITVNGIETYNGATGDISIVNPVPIAGDKAAVVVLYTDGCGTFTYTWNLTALACVPTPQIIIPFYTFNGTDWFRADQNTIPGQIDANLGDIIQFGLNPTNGEKKSWLWTGACTSDLYNTKDYGTATTIREPNFNVYGSCKLTATLTYDDGCGNAAATTSYDITVIADGVPLAVDKFEQAGFKMYPSPADNVLNITYNGDLSVSIINVAGQQVLSPRSISKQGSVDVSSLSAGIYFLKAVANGESIVKKFVKK